MILLQTYDFEFGADRRLAFVPNNSEERTFLVCAVGTPAGELMNRWCQQRFACRQFDCKDVTDEYLSDLKLG
jgi:hypothetical protein